jgi:hypothetical protein
MSDGRERAIEKMMTLWPNAPVLRDEAEAMLNAAEFDRIVAERDCYRKALEEIEAKDHEHGPGWFAEIAARALWAAEQKEER